MGYSVCNSLLGRPGKNMKRAFRYFLGSVTASILIMGLSPGSIAATNTSGGVHRDYFRAPDAALVRTLGAIPPGPCDPTGSQFCAGAPRNPFDAVKGSYPLDATGLGIPLGGVGAGTFMINQSGTFGPWTFGGEQNGDRWESRILPQAAFHVREQMGHNPASVRTLATKGPKNVGKMGPVPDRCWGDPLPAWTSLQLGDATYAALYPFGWINYIPFKADISMRFFSPIVPGNDRRTSLPVAYFDIRVANHTKATDHISIMFTMPNAPAHVGSKTPSIRKGFSNRFLTDSASGISGVTMSADDPSNTPDEDRSEWSIAVKPQPGQTMTYATSWNAEGDGSDIYTPFSNNGNLANASIDSSNSASAIAISVTLRPGQITTVHFALTWDFPQVTYSNLQTVWMRRYTGFYGSRVDAAHNYIAGSYPFHQSFQMANDALQNHEESLAAVEKWWRPIATDPAYPKQLRTAALNQLSQVAFTMPLWEAGLVSNKFAPDNWKRLAAGVEGTHLFFQPDASAGGATAMDTATGSYGYLAYNLFYPSIEKDRLRARAQAIMLDPNGSIGDWSLDGPYTKWDPKGQPAPETQTFLDVPSKTIFRMYAYAFLHHDSAFLRDVYPAMKRQMAFLMATVKSGEHLPRVGVTKPGDALPKFPNIYDVIPVAGRDIYDSELYLLSLEVMIEAGKQVGEESETIGQWKHELASGKEEVETVFWDPKQRWYRYTEYVEGSATLVDTFLAQHVAERLGLSDLVDLSHYREELTLHYGAFMTHRDKRGELVGPSNMILPSGVSTWPLLINLFGMHTAIQEPEVWSSTGYLGAATWYHAGERFADPQLKSEGIEMGVAVANQIWKYDENGFAFDAPLGWKSYNVALYTYPGYSSPLGIWDLIDAIKPVEHLLSESSTPR